MKNKSETSLITHNYLCLKTQLSEMSPEEIKIWVNKQSTIEDRCWDNKEYLFSLIQAVCDELGIDLKTAYFRFNHVLIFIKATSAILIIEKAAFLFEKCGFEQRKEWRYFHSFPLKGDPSDILFITKNGGSISSNLEFDWSQDPYDEFRITYRSESNIPPERIVLD